MRAHGTLQKHMTFTDSCSKTWQVLFMMKDHANGVFSFCFLTNKKVSDTLWWTNMAVENLPLEDVFPTGTGDFPYKILNFVAERSCGPPPWKSCIRVL